MSAGEVQEASDKKDNNTDEYSFQQNIASQHNADEGNGVPNMGNPVFTPHKQMVQTASTIVTPPGSLGDMVEVQHPMYATTSSTYGKQAPSVECMPTSFHGRSQKFSKHLSQSGMYRNHSLNTARDHTSV